MIFRIILISVLALASNYLGAQCEWCNNATAKTLTLNCTSSAMPLTYSWTGPGGFSSTNSSIVPTTAGVYVGECTDANGCVISTSETVTIHTPVDFSNTANITNASCGASNGQIQVTPTNLISSIVWDHGPTTTTVTGLAAGTYVATITDTNGCITMNSYTVVEDSAPVLSAIADISVCNPSLAVFVNYSLSTTSVANYTFTLEQVAPPGGVIATNGPTSVTSGTFGPLTGLADAIYQVQVQDGNGCFSSESFLISIGDLTGSITCN